jgi:CDP-glucose 4,6-dehydratase
MVTVGPFGGAYRGKRVLLTGHTGFKGSWLSLWLAQLGAEVTGYSLQPPTTPSLFEAARLEGTLRHIEADVRDSRRLRRVVAETRPHVVFHLAAQSIVRVGYRMPAETVETNVMGTVNILEAVRAAAADGSPHPLAVIVVTSDKCYENREWVYGYREDDPMGGHDPYSMSKAGAELAVSAWRRSFFPDDKIPAHRVRLASVRAGNVIGGGDWGIDRVVPDCVSSLREGHPIGLRNPAATRPWQHVLDPLSGYLLLGERLMTAEPDAAALHADAWNFGPMPDGAWTVARLVDEVVRNWGSGSWTDLSDARAPHEAAMLALCCDKARLRLGWMPAWDVPKAVAMTVSWYRHYDAGEDVRELTLGQIAEYVSDAAGRGVSWAAPAAAV